METAESLADFAEIFGTLKAALDGLPAQVIRDMTLRREIETALHDILRLCADSFEQKAAAALRAES